MMKVVSIEVVASQVTRRRLLLRVALMTPLIESEQGGGAVHLAGHVRLSINVGGSVLS